LIESSSKIRFLEGDIEKQGLGLSLEDLQTIKDISKIYHLAACINLKNTEKTRENLFVTNVGGTENILNLVKILPNVSNFCFISTAYLGEDSNQEIPEDWIDRPNEFRNPYEESKWECENIVKTKLTNSQINYQIIRPSILLDTLENIEKISSQTVYLFSNILKNYLTPDIKLIKLGGNPNSVLNFVFVEDLVKFILEVDDLNESKIFNFVSEKNIYLKDILKIIVQNLSISTEIYFINKNSPSHLEKNEVEFNALLSPFLPYLNLVNLKWSRKNTISVLDRSGFNLDYGDKIFENIGLYCRKIKKNDK
jgi:nucleoside-diphosphate-sugar epimerase